MKRQHWTIVVVLLLAGPAAAGQRSTLATSEARAFIGTWVVAMTEPPRARETVRIWDNDGKIAASVQAQQFPPIEAFDLAKVSESLVLAATRHENGQPIEAIIILRLLDGETIDMIQELQGSRVTKRGSGMKE